MSIYLSCDYCGKDIEGDFAQLKPGGFYESGGPVPGELRVFHPGERDGDESCFEKALAALDLAGYYASGESEQSTNPTGMEWRLVPVEDEQPPAERIAGETGNVATLTKPRVAAGTHQRQARELIHARPGITISELAVCMGVKANVLYRVLPRLKQLGLVEKVGKGWHPA